MQKSKNKPHPQRQSARRWILIWLALCSAVVLVTVLQFELVAWPELVATEIYDWCGSHPYAPHEIECHIMSHNDPTRFGSLSELTQIPIIGAGLGIVLMMFPLFYPVVASIFALLGGVLVYRDRRRIAYGELALSLAILVVAIGLMFYLYGSEQGTYYFVWMWD